MEIINRTPPAANQIIAYGTQSSQFGELRLPSSSGPYPVVVGIHGGWWRAAHGLETHSHICAALTDAGFATWNIEYRRIGESGGGWPGTMIDVGNAIDFLRTIESEFSLDLNRVFTVGFSAGGHLAAWAALRKNINPNSAIHSDTPLNISGCVSLAGALDLEFCQKAQLSSNVVVEFLKGTRQEIPDRYNASSPTELIANGSVDTFFRLFHGVNDTSVPYAISERFFNSAVNVGVDCTISPLKDTHHFELIDPKSKVWAEIAKCILEFKR